MNYFIDNSKNGICLENKTVVYAENIDLHN